MNPCVQYFYFPRMHEHQQWKLYRPSVAVEVPSKDNLLTACAPFNDLALGVLASVALCSPEDNFHKPTARAILNTKLAVCPIKPIRMQYETDHVLVVCSVAGLRGIDQLWFRINKHCDRVYFVGARET